MNGQETFKKIAEALPYEIQSALLSIRDDENVTARNIPEVVFYALCELTLIEQPQSDEEIVQLSKLGSRLVDFCTC